MLKIQFTLTKGLNFNCLFTDSAQISYCSFFISLHITTNVYPSSTVVVISFIICLPHKQYCLFFY